MPADLSQHRRDEGISNKLRVLFFGDQKFDKPDVTHAHYHYIKRAQPITHHYHHPKRAEVDLQLRGVFESYLCASDFVEH